MEDNQIISILIDKLNDEELWFTQKTDPTWEEPAYYYKLDEYGDLVDTSKKQIVKEIKSYIGDGAVDIDDAIDTWIQNACMEYRVAYVSVLVTRFKDKQAIDGIEAYTSNVLKEGRNLKKLNEHTESDEFKIKDNLKSKAFPNRLYSEALIKLVENGTLDPLGVIRAFVNSLSEEEVKKICKSYQYDVQMLDIPTLTKNKKLHTENMRRRLEEENNKSATLISDMFKSSDFDSDSKQGQIVMRTSELFNTLSGKGYDVQVSFDNGESTNAILLGQQGGQVIITITDTNQPLRAFTSGNFEVNDDNLKVLADIQNQISSL